MLGVTLTPTMVHASDKINVIPGAELKVDCRVHARPRRGPRPRRGRGGDRSDGVRIEFDERVIGNRSPIDTPLMSHIRDGSSARTRAPSPPRASSRASPTRAGSARPFPDCVAYGFFPQSQMDLFESAPLIHGADERIRWPTSGWPRASTPTSHRGCSAADRPPPGSVSGVRRTKIVATIGPASREPDVLVRLVEAAWTSLD
jgi:hypothetical protein